MVMEEIRLTECRKTAFLRIILCTVTSYPMKEAFSRRKLGFYAGVLSMYSCDMVDTQTSVWYDNILPLVQDSQLINGNITSFADDDEEDIDEDDEDDADDDNDMDYKEEYGIDEEDEFDDEFGDDEEIDDDFLSEEFFDDVVEDDEDDDFMDDDI